MNLVYEKSVSFGKKRKFSPRYIEPNEILERIGPVAYRIALPPTMSNIHNVFHVFMMHKHAGDPSHVIRYEPLQIREDLTYVEHLVQVLDRRYQVLKNKTIPLMKVLWRNHSLEEAT